MGLVLAREVGQAIMVGDKIRIEIVEVRGDRVRLRIEAPPEIAVHREEVFMAIERERAQNCRPRDNLKATGGLG